MAKQVDIVWLTSQIDDKTIKGITNQLIKLINDEQILIGSVLPPVKQLAQVLGISPASLSAVLKVLRQYNMVRGVGRQGITVIGKAVVPAPARFSTEYHFAQPVVFDLTKALSDPLLLPDWKRAISKLDEIEDINVYRQDPICSILKKAVAMNWPYSAEHFLTAESDFEALSLIFDKIILPNSCMLIEEPAPFAQLDVLKRLNVKLIPIRRDKYGPVLADIIEGLKHNPVAFIYQPRLHFITGQRIDKIRFKQMSKLFRFKSTMIIEHDILEQLSDNYPSSKQLSMGKYYPEKTIYIRSYLKSYGPDLGLGVISATKELIKQLQDIRGHHRLGWDSRLLQYILAILLTDPQTQRKVNKARAIYNRRYNALIDALNLRGFNLSHGEGHNLWLAVPSEKVALAGLASRGIQVMGGSKFFINQNAPAHIRIRTYLLSEKHNDIIADALAEVLQKKSNSLEKVYQLAFNGVRQKVFVKTAND